jgi:hypothetical protein
MRSIKNISSSDIEKVIAGYRYGRYLEDRSLDREASRRLVEDKINEYVQRDDTDYVVEHAGQEEIQGLLLFKLSPWDTEHFGIKTSLIEYVLVREPEYEARISIANRLLLKYQAWCELNKIRFVFVKISSSDLPVLHAFEKNGFCFMENWIFNKYDLTNLDTRSQQSFDLRLMKPSDLDPMLSYSRGALTTHRFHADSYIPLEKAETLYEKWILTAFHDPHQKILVYESHNRPVAFMIYHPYDLRSYFNLRFAMWKMALMDPRLKEKGSAIIFSFLFYIIIKRKAWMLSTRESALGISFLSIYIMSWISKTFAR